MKHLVALVAVSAAFITTPSTAQTVTSNLTASITPTGNHLNDDRLRAYVSFPTVFDGFMRFDISSIPDNAFIQALTLTTYHEFGFSNPLGTPIVSIYEVSSDSWSRTAGSPTLGNVLSPAYTSFPAAEGVAFTWTLTPGLIDWQTHLADNTLSLAMHNSDSGYSYVYWHGSDNASLAPQLNFTLGTPVSGAVPEPGTWALMLIGFGAMGVSLRRRRSTHDGLKTA